MKTDYDDPDASEAVAAIEAAILYQCADCAEHAPDMSCWSAEASFLLDGRVICAGCLECGDYDQDRAVKVSSIRSTLPAPTTREEVLEAAAREAIELLTRRKYGSSARSPSHNARLVLESALSSAREMSDIVAWVLTRDCDPTFPRAYGSKEAALKAMAPMNVGPLPVLHEVPSATLRHKLEEAERQHQDVLDEIEDRLSELTWEDAGEPVKWKDIRRAFIRALKGDAK